MNNENSLEQKQPATPVASSAVTVLFVRAQSIYKLLPACDCYDRGRDARQYAGNDPVVAHHPCRTWGNLRTMATKAPADEHDLSPWAIDQVRRCGGVLEHPAGSTLFDYRKCGTQERPDEWGGYTIKVNQFDWGHRCNKPTKLYIVGCVDLPAMPKRDGQPTHCITQGHGIRIGHPLFKSRVPQWEREATPPEFAKWLVEVAIRCRGHNGPSSAARKLP